MSKSWKTTFENKLRDLREEIPLHENNPQARIAIAGVGHELRGDDAAGLAIVRALKSLLTDRSWLCIIEAGPAPENASGVLRRFKPDLVLLVDAALMNADPGTVRWLDPQDTRGFSASSHTLPLRVVAGFLASELNCEVALLGIQPGANALGTPLTEPVQAAVDATAAALTDLLTP